MSYEAKVADLAKEIIGVADDISATKRARADWLKPKERTIFIGYHAHVVRADGSVDPALEGVQREALAVIDQRLHMLRSKIEGLRWRLVQLGKEGG